MTSGKASPRTIHFKISFVVTRFRRFI